MSNITNNDVPVQDAYTLRVRDMLARLAQLKNVRLTDSGTFVAECPADESHDLGAWVAASGELTVQCPVCSTDSQRSQVLAACLRDVFGNEGIAESRLHESVPVSAWLEQPVSSPLVAARLLSNGSMHVVVRPGREAELGIG